MFEPIEDREKYDYQALNRALDRVKSSVFMGKNSAFFGPMMCALEFYWSEEVDTAATDGVRMWWNPKFFLEAPEKFACEKFNEFVLLHELWHNARLHMLRQGTRESDLWNYACDVRINNDLVKAKHSYGTFNAWYMPHLDNNGIMTEEDIYDHLFKDNFQVPANPWGNGDFQDISEEDKQKVINNVVKSVTNAKMEGDPGSIPGNTETMLDHFLAPIIPWEQHLAHWMTELQNFDFSWARPNRRYTEMYLPSKFEDDGRLAHLVYFQDVSGSITNQEIIRFNSELKYVWDDIKPLRMTVIQFDTRITKVDEYYEGDEFTQIEILGRGGTSLVCVREKILELKPTAAIIFSDMCVSPMQALPEEIAILWVISNNSTATVPFGKKVHIK